MSAYFVTDENGNIREVYSNEELQESYQQVFPVVPPVERITIFRIIKSIDEHAFISQANVNGVYGNGFDQVKVKVKKTEEAPLPKEKE